MTIEIKNPFGVFTDTDGSPLDNGYIYIGTQYLNAQTNPIAVYWDAGLTIPAAQPIRTINGYPSRSGSPANIYSLNEYSIIVKNKNGALVFSSNSVSSVDYFLGYTTTVTAAATTTLTSASTYQQYFTGTTTQTVVLPDVTTLSIGKPFRFVNNSTGAVTVNSSGGNLVATVSAGEELTVTCIAITGTGAASWDSSASHKISVGTGTAASHAVRIDQLRSRVDGLNLSPNGTTTCGISAGVAIDSTDSIILSLSSAFTKTTSAWAVGTGNGAFDGTGADPTTADTFHWFVIRRPDTGVQDVLFSHSPTAPTLPANYTQFAYIGSTMSIVTTGVWRAGTHIGDYVRWDTPSNGDINFTSATTAAAAYALPVPLGVKVLAHISGYGQHATATNTLYLSSRDDTEDTGSGSRFSCIIPSNGAYATVDTEVWTDTSQQIDIQTSDTSFAVRLSVLGYMNPRGRNA